MKFIYQNIIKPILFKFPADDVHRFFLEAGYYLSNNKNKLKIFNFFFNYKNLILKEVVKGCSYENPIGLAAGFDYDADLIGVLPSLGFGAHTIGTVTYLPYEGNPKPMLGRLPKSKSLLVNKGFKSNGLKAVLKKIAHRESSIPLGISIGSTNQPYKNIEGMIEDIYSSFEIVLKKDKFDYYELNISCPNLINVENLKDKFDQPLGFGMLLNRLSYLNINKPLYVKMYAEQSPDETLALCAVAERYRFVSGFILSNLVKDRTNPNFDQEEIGSVGKGNFSGKPTFELSNNLISAVYNKYRNRFIIIGCGGIFTGADAYEKIKRGASLLQLITGMVYNGPSVIGSINKELASLLAKDGFTNIKEAVGTYKD